MKIKLEIDQEPAAGFTTDIKCHLHPIPFTIKSMTLPSLFAGKMHALLCRTVRNNIKGRDWYDLIWFEKNKEIDFSLAKRDVEPFLKDSRQRDELDLWSDALFNEYLIQQIEFTAIH